MAPSLQRRLLVARVAGPPERLVAAVRGAGEHEEEIRQPVEVDRGERVRSLDGEDRQFRAAADRSRDVEARRGLGSAGQDEAPERLEAAVRVVDLGLEPVDVRLLDPEPVVAGDGEIGAEIEELVLDAVEACSRPSDEGISSSTSPSATMRGASFDTREPSPRLVCPLSPPPV